MDDARLGDQLLLALRIVRVGHAAVDGAHGGALLLIEEADAFRALAGDDEIHILRERGVRLPLVIVLRAAFVDGGVRALRLAGPAVDACLGDHRRHASTPRTGESDRLLPPAARARQTRRASQRDAPRPGRAAASRTRAATARASARTFSLTACAG